MDQATIKLIKRAQSGDTEAFHSLVKLYDNRVMTLAYGILQNEQDAEDLYQEVFIKVYKNIKGFRFESEFFTWLYRITVNTAFNYKKKVSKYAHVEFNSEEGANLYWISDPKAKADEDSSHVQQALMDAVEILPQKQRTVFLLKHIENLKITDIAGLLDIGEGTVKKYLFRAMEKLRIELKEYRYV